ncbi:MAG: glycosyltransferase [Cyanobacteria bacterium P01_A01_bin.116]
MKVTIVLTVYNREQYLPAAIESFLTQTYTQTELLIWDDGSTDKSLTIAQNYASQNPHIQVIPAVHRGRITALYDAMEMANGTYIGWLDSDDLLRPTAIEETVAILDKHPSIGMVYTDYWVINEQGTIQGLGNRCLIPYSQKRLLVDFMTFHFRLFRQAVYVAAGKLDQSMTYAQDYDLCLKLSEITEIYHLKSALYLYRNHNNSISNQQKPAQIRCSYRAISNALARRKMNKTWSLELVPGPQFILRKKAVE